MTEESVQHRLPMNWPSAERAAVNPTSTQLRVLQKGAMRTRLDSSPRKKDQGYGYGRVCEESSCTQVLNHFNPGPCCNVCERRRVAEGLAA